MAATEPSTKSAATAPNLTVIEQVESESRRTTLVILGVLLVIAVAVGTYVGVKQSLKEMRATALQARLDAELRALNVWVRQETNLALRWAKDTTARDAILTILAAAARTPGTNEDICAAGSALRLRELLRAALFEGHFLIYDVIDRSGRIVASSDAAQCGQRVSTRQFLSRLDPVFAARSVFVRPLLEIERMAEARPKLADQPLVWIAVPVLDTDGRVVAALAFGEAAAGEFSALLRSSALGESDELFLFDERAVLLSDSRHADKLASAGAIKNPSSPRTMLQVEIRVPVNAESDGTLSTEERAAQPRTRLAAVAIASQTSTDPRQQRGVLIDPYRNYYGAEVVGAWRWLADYDVGAALEIEAAEAFAPVRFLDRLFAIVLGLSATVAVGVVIALFSNARLRAGLGSVRRLGRYTLLREIGEGGMASVYQGRHALLKRPIAIKILKRALATDEMIARFEREVQLASQLTHPNTIDIYDYGRTRGGDFYYVMEYLQGITLAALVARDGALGSARSIYLLRQVGAALKEAHTRGIVHRDIKPENIMACMRGGEFDVVKVLDFGLVKSMSDAVSRDITRSIRVLGTPAYMAPERFANASAVDQRADIYGLGAVAYLLLSGKRIFEDASGDDLQWRILHSAPAPLSASGMVPAALESLVMRCMEKRPEDRPATVAEFMVILEQLALSYPWSQAEAERWWRDYLAASPLQDQQEKK